jgi:fatty-acid peroxygenase
LLLLKAPNGGIREVAGLELMQECNFILTRAACEWTGVPLNEGEDDGLARQLSSMIENTGHFGPSMWAALLRRNGTERRLGQHVRDVRNCSLVVSPDQPLAIIAGHRNEDGQLLAIKVAVVELLKSFAPSLQSVATLCLPRSNCTATTNGAECSRAGIPLSLATSLKRSAASLLFPFVGAIVKEDLDWEGDIAKRPMVIARPIRHKP